MTVTVPEAPALVTLRQVELIQVGSWNISTGPWQPCTDDLYQAVAATECPAVRQPVLKLGHNDPRASGDGEPALGWVGDLAVTNGGSTLIGDYKGMPGWFAHIIGSAYPDRSIEGHYDFECQLGHIHPFVLSAVALLGVTAPGIGTLESLNARSIADLYGVAASSSSDTTAVSVTVRGSAAMPPISVAAQATTTDVMNQFYDQPAAATNWWLWVEELFIDPMQIIACDGSDDTLWQYSYSIDADGTVTFGDPTQVLRTYVTASASGAALRFASLAESRPAAAAHIAARRAFAATSQTQTEDIDPAQPEKEDSTMSDLATELRTRLGVADDADDATIVAALDEALAERADDQVTAAAAPGTVTVDAAQFEQLRQDAAAGRTARDEQVTARRVGLVDAAVRDGRIAPANRDGWLAHLASGSDSMRAAAEKQLTDLVPNTFPVSPLGHSQGSTEASGAENGENAFVPGKSKGWVVAG